MAQLHIGVVGSGGIAGPHVTSWLAADARVSVYSTDSSAGEFAGQHGIENHETLDDLLDAVDVVDVCTPTSSHKELVLAAAAAGRDVVCEKPLALSHADGAAMIAACREAGVSLLPAQVVRYFPEYAAAHAEVAAGIIGKPAVVRLSRRGAKPVRSWFADPARSGGLLIDQMIHDFDYARWIAGEVEAVYAKVVEHGDGLAAGYAILTHRDGALTHVRGGWGPPSTVFETSFTISGSAGQLRHSSSERSALRWDSPVVASAAGALLPEIDEANSPFVAELAEFAAAFLTGAPPRVSAEDGLAALDIALAATESAATGRPVDPGNVGQ